ncbi:hypothetical protein SAMD00019534_030910 [Acytostelium subglobosum LB1]|uniref:hypothetical protein n=1 Tax=Acytostelium subglobosum LB1 TaxID=1410327 RepID=UPI000644D909|nr:hypothetical protein SAMD00019534_030910 [Acytostelium subglobosum LB1]GAM19916.1 hypothetical protein SAMD00019534_030910 [Acytostelium subglobosum LB1]|eukprot:XP_012756678.1 hypothetical protein SAMD00019534_030910 [Acytostelium subglobosum LB1]
MSVTPNIFCIGNPLLDISAHTDMAFIEKYGLQLGNAILAEDKHLPLYTEVKSYKVDYIPGGAAQNTARVAQWMLNKKQTVMYSGCVGNDENGRILREATEANGVVVKYLVDAEEPTGACAVLINNAERCLTTNLGAANKFKIAHLESSEMTGYINSTQYFYLVGYFMTVSPESAMMLAKHAADNNKTFLYGLAAPFLIEVDFFFERVKALIPYVDYLFANESEAACIGKKMGWGESLPVIAEKLSQWEKVNNNRSRTIIFTQGPQSTLVYQNGQLTEYKPIPLGADKIVDLNAAGDSFCGGFLAALSLGKPIAECVAAAHYAASEIIQQNGCTLPTVRALNLE